MSAPSRNAVDVAGSILVVGLHGHGPDTDWASFFNDRVIVARSRSIAERIIPPDCQIEHAFDDLFEDHLADVERSIAESVVRLAGGANVVYLVPGPGSIGDGTVSSLSEQSPVQISAPRPFAPLYGHVQVVDALHLAQAQERAPFDTGSSPLDATVPAVVYNWHSDSVIDLATRRLLSIYGRTSLPDADRFGTLIVEARDPLDAPPSFAALEYITARLRRPDGCPWDREQTHESMLDDFASEVEEYAEAVRAGDWQHAAEELGDVLLNVLMQTQIGTETGHFTVEDVLAGINAKLVRRHPHVFAGVDATTPDDVLAVWNSVKQQELSNRSNGESSSRRP